MKWAAFCLVLALAMIPCLGEDYVNLDPNATNSIGEGNLWLDFDAQDWAVCIAAVTIYQDGSIKIDENYTTNEAARLFWKTVYETYPTMFTNKVPTWEEETK